jgi:hypothetical protein
MSASLLTTTPLSLALAGLDLADAVGTPMLGEPLFRAQLDLARRWRISAVQLNAAAAGLRARELSRTGRRDLAALLRRSGIALSGGDLWIPPEHFIRPEHADRAVAAVLDAIELLADLGQLLATQGDTPLAVMLPSDAPESIINTISDRATTCGVPIADFTFTQPAPAQTNASTNTSATSQPPAPPPSPDAPIGPGVDPAGIFMAGGDPIAIAARLGASLRAARLSDVSSAGRRAVGGPRSLGGRLDVQRYAITLGAVTKVPFVTLDLRQVPDQLDAAPRAIAAWRNDG